MSSTTMTLNCNLWAYPEELKIKEMRMKKIISISLSLLLSSVFALNVFAIEAKITSVEGKVQVGSNNNWRNATVGMVVRENEIIQTGFKSSCVVSVVSKNEDSKLTVAQLSRLTLDELIENDTTGDKTSVSLSLGSVKSEIKRTSDLRTNYQVRSPVATASVRGTVLTVTNKFDSTTVKTHSGVVSTKKNSFKKSSSDSDVGSIAVSANQSAEFTDTTSVSSSQNAVKNTTISDSLLVNAFASEAVGVVSNADISATKDNSSVGNARINVTVSFITEKDPTTGSSGN